MVRLMGSSSGKPASAPEPSYVLAARDYADIAHLENPSVIERILSGTRSQGLAYVSALLQSGVSRYVLAGPKVALTAMAIEALTDLSREILAWRKAGTIPEDFSGRPSGYQTWVDLLKEIDSNPVDGERLKAMKAMFLAANQTNATDGQSILAYQLFQIAKTLTSGELLLLKAVFEAYRNSVFGAPTQRVTLDGWAQTMASRLGHGLSTLVIRDSVALEQSGLLNARVVVGSAPHQTNENWVLPVNARITDLGMKFCENIRNYEAVAEPKPGAPL
jgi:hypothetical protein